jgi:hypothetical protein
MKIQIQDKSENGEVFVWGLWGPKTIEHILGKINQEVQTFNGVLRELAQ